MPPSRRRLQLRRRKTLAQQPCEEPDSPGSECEETDTGAYDRETDENDWPAAWFHFGFVASALRMSRTPPLLAWNPLEMRNVFPGATVLASLAIHGVDGSRKSSRGMRRAN